MPTSTIFSVKERSVACVSERCAHRYISVRARHDCVPGSTLCCFAPGAAAEGKMPAAFWRRKASSGPSAQVWGHNTKHSTNCQHCFPDGLGYEAPPWEGPLAAQLGEGAGLTLAEEQAVRALRLRKKGAGSELRFLLPPLLPPPRDVVGHGRQLCGDEGPLVVFE